MSYGYLQELGQRFGECAMRRTSRNHHRPVLGDGHRGGVADGADH